jgi:hypothetical protein
MRVCRRGSRVWCLLLALNQLSAAGSMQEACDGLRSPPMSKVLAAVAHDQLVKPGVVLAGTTRRRVGADKRC